MAKLKKKAGIAKRQLLERAADIFGGADPPKRFICNGSSQDASATLGE